ncbi:MAG: hypothetical protein ACK4MV_01025 [Beijerinckiaceae bacterium]
MAGATAGSFPRTVSLGFVAGALGVLFFHQIMGWFISGRIPWSNWSPVPPFAVPVIVNQTFWGGVWGIVFAFFYDRFPKGLAYLVAAFAFGAVFPTLVAWCVIPLIKGGAIGPRGVWYNGPLLNGAWGFGAGLCLAIFRRIFR